MANGERYTGKWRIANNKYKQNLSLAILYSQLNNAINYIFITFPNDGCLCKNLYEWRMTCECPCKKFCKSQMANGVQT